MRKFKLGLRGKTFLLAIPAFLLLLNNFGQLQLAARALGQQQMTTQMQRASYLVARLGQQANSLAHSGQQLLSKRLDAEAAFVPQLDGRVNDWQPHASEIFSAAAKTFILMARHQNFVYFLVQVEQSLAADAALFPVQIRMDFQSPDQVNKGWVLRPRLSGEVVFYAAEGEAASALSDVSQRSAFADFSKSGYRLEVSIPLAEIDLRRPVTFEVKVSGQPVEAPARVSFSDLSNLQLPVLHAAQLDVLTEGLADNRTRYWLVDRYKQVQAMQGIRPDLDIAGEDASKSFFARKLAPLQRWWRKETLRLMTPSAPPPYRQSAYKLLDLAFSGTPAAGIALQAEGSRIISAAHPVRLDGNIVGALLISNELAHTASAKLLLDILAPAIFKAMLILIVVIFLFAAINILMARRLLRLSSETKHSTDRHGQLKFDYLDKEIKAGDEIGHLVRNISGLLLRLHQHNQFLERMPRTLRHEINNPLNVVSISLQNLAAEIPESQTSKYMESAKRGVLRIGSIVQYLADAVSLEESLKTTEREVVDIGALLKNYVANCQLAYPDVRFVYHGTWHPVYAEVSDYSIEQLLDKVIDNAIDFQTKGTEIKIQLATLRDDVQVIVSNYGPILPRGLAESLFDSMVTQRPAGKDSKLHFGLGLHVVKVIAEYHNGSVRADNLENSSGVRMTVSLPRAVARKSRWMSRKKAPEAE